MKRIVGLAVLALCMPIAAFAGGIDFTTHGGKVKQVVVGESSELSLGGSEITQITGIPGSPSGALGSISFTTAALTSGSLSGPNATFAAGGTFDIRNTNASDGLPLGVIFKGTFSGPVNWTEVTGGSSGSIYYTLSGQISGSWYNGQTVSGESTFTFNAGKDGFMGSAPVTSGDTNISTVPEPGTLGLLGTGLLGLGGILRKKIKA